MKSYFPLTDYDFWAYLTSGGLFLAVLDRVFQTGWISHRDWTILQGALIVALAYIMGHLLAGVASALLERRLLAGWLGAPVLVLFDVVQGPSWFRWFNRSYYEPLPKETRDRILRVAAADEIGAPGDALFWLAFSFARKNSTAMERMSSFLNQYGMCRNLSLTALLSSGLLLWSAACNARTDDYYLAVISAGVGLALFLRYAKFYRHYVVEVLTTFAYKP